MVAHLLTTCHMKEKQQHFLYHLAKRCSLRPFFDFRRPIPYLFILPLTVCPISHELLTKRQINYPLAFRKLLFSSGRRISHVLPAQSSPCNFRNLGGHSSFETAQHSSYIWINEVYYNKAPSNG